MKGIVFTGDKAEVLDGLEVREPGAGEVIVKVMAAGVCHSDVTAAAGAFGWPSPAVLGHEGAGIVEKVGTGVTHVVEGDHVIISTLAACGVCKACAQGKPTRCRQTLGNMAQPFTLDGEACWNFAAASVFTERTVIRGFQAVKIPKDVPFTSACLVGCGVMTGAGAVLYRSDVKIGQTAVVYGCGGVGLNAIQALRVKRASRSSSARLAVTQPSHFRTSASRKTSVQSLVVAQVRTAHIATCFRSSISIAVASSCSTNS